MDEGAYYRLVSAIRGTLDALADKSTMSGDALPGAYRTLRAEAREVAGAARAEEFDRLFPVLPTSTRNQSVRSGFDPIEASASANEAKALLGRLAGWLDGFVQEAQAHAVAVAYAEAKVKAERGVGFRPSE